MKKLYLIISRYFLLLLLSLFIVSFIPRNDKMKIQRIKAFIPPDFELYDIASGDINGDKLMDYVLILKSKNEINNPNEARPLLLLRGTTKGRFELMARNDRVVLCGNCGGAFGDPSPRIEIKDMLVSIENNVGTNWRYTRTITFKFNPELEELILHKDSGISYHISAPKNQKNSVTNESDFDKLTFADYSYNKGF